MSEEDPIKLKELPQPMGARVLIQKLSGETKTAGGLFLPDSAVKEKQEGIVVRLGTGVDAEGNDVDFDLKEGDKVFVSRSGGSLIEVAGQNYYIIDEDKILGVIGE